MCCFDKYLMIILHLLMIINRGWSWVFGHLVLTIQMLCRNCKDSFVFWKWELKWPYVLITLCHAPHLPSPSTVFFQAALNDSHSMLIVHWAGEESSVIIALAKSSRYARPNTLSKVYLSNDYGETFTDITERIRGPGYPLANIDKYYNSDTVNSHVSRVASPCLVLVLVVYLAVTGTATFTVILQFKSNFFLKLHLQPLQSFH